MANTFTSLHYHLIFSTKQRIPLIRPEMETRLWSYLGGIACEHKMKPVQIGGMPDHIHLATSVPASLSLSKAVQELKSNSSKWIKHEFPNAHDFAWQDGYGAFTISKSNLLEVTHYVQNQKEHHRTRSFQEEYLTFLTKHEIDFDERYVWD